MTSLEAIADALGTTVSSQSGVTFASMGSGTLDPKFIGALSNAPIGVVSGPVPGTIGVYVYQVKGRDTGSFYTEDDAALYELQKNQYNSQMLMSVMMDDADGMDVAKGFSVKGSSSFDTRVSQAVRAGFEIVPNRNDIRYYYKTCTYRLGAYYEDSRFAVDGNQIKDIGLTFGASLPVFRYYNSVTLAVNLGQRGSVTGNMIRERYVNFTVGFNFHDIWFQKFTYK